jgi:hypothetical protein
MNNILLNKHSIFGKLGDFWQRQLSESATGGIAFANTFSHLTDGNQAVGQLRGISQRLAGSSNNIISNVSFTFNPADVSIINLNIDARAISGTYPYFNITKPGQYTLEQRAFLQVGDLPSTTGSDPSVADISVTLGDNDNGGIRMPIEDRDIVLTSDEARLLYYVPIAINLTPIAIATEEKELTIGTGFLTAPGYILFYESPNVLFPNSRIFCRSAYVKESHLMDYTYQVDNIYSGGEYMAQYMRATHSAPALRLAVAEIAGLPIIKTESILEAIYYNTVSTIYEFDTCVIRVPDYIEHTTLTVGTTYSAGTIIGEDYVKVYSKSNGTATPWYRHSDLASMWSSKGLVLSALTPFTSVIAADVTGTFSNNGATGSGTAHLKLSGVTGSSTGSYWNFVRQSEIHTSKYIANVPGVTAGATANVIDFYFDNMLTFNAVIIKLRTQELGSEIHENVLSFLRRDLPINVTPIILM